MSSPKSHGLGVIFEVKKIALWNLRLYKYSYFSLDVTKLWLCGIMLGGFNIPLF